MPRGGRRPGGGRPKGSLNKTTITKLSKRAEVVAAVIDSGKPLAVTVMQKAMEFAEGAVAMYRPTTKAEIAAGVKENLDGDREEFGRWFDRWVTVMDKLSRFQTPHVKAMESPTAAPEVNKNDRVLKFTLKVFEGGRQVLLKKPPLIDNETGEELDDE